MVPAVLPEPLCEESGATTGEPLGATNWHLRFPSMELTHLGAIPNHGPKAVRSTVFARLDNINV